MATYRVLLFSVLKQKVGDSIVHVEIDGSTTGRDLLDRLVADYPLLADYRSIVRMAVNHEYAHEDVRLSPTDEIALITPVSGG